MLYEVITGLKADIVSHGRALKEDIDVSLSCDAKWCAAYLGISDIHLKDKLRITREQAMERAVETVEYAKSHGLKIRFTVEDGSRAEPEFLLKMCRAIEDVITSYSIHYTKLYDCRKTWNTN